MIESNSTIFFGGPILTIDDNTPEVEALAIRDGRIIALGDRKKVFQLHSQRTRMIDLNGRTLMPGFIDAHVHLAWSASIEHRWLNVSTRDVPNRHDLLALLKNATASKKEGEWVLAFGYDPGREAGSERPLDAMELNKISTTHPIFVLEGSWQAAHVNQQALEIALLPEAKNSNGGNGYTRDSRGVLTGEVRGTTALASFFHAFHRAGFDQDVDDCMKVLREWARRGCTTVYDAAVGALCGQEEVRLLLNLASDPGTPVRIRAALVPTGGLPRIAGIRPWQGNDRLSFVGIKFAADGPELGTASALADVLPYETAFEQLNYDDEDLKIQMQEWHDSSWQLLVRATGFNAVEQALRTFESVLMDSPNPKHRHRLDRCPLIDERQLRWASEIGLSVSHLIGQVNQTGLSHQARSRIIPLASEFANNLRVSLHSDSPVSAVRPLHYLQTALTRRIQEDPISGDDQRISIDKALKTITIFPAYQCFLDHKVGTLAVGKLADLVVLDQNPRSVDPHQLAQIEVLETYLQGVPQS